jgi:hypothetical protein
MPDSSDEEICGRESYARWMDADDAARFRETSADADLDNEIRLMRLAAGKLSEDVNANHVPIIRILVVLCRALGMKARLEGSAGDLQRELEQMGEVALETLERHEPDPD